jgi:putative addiction module killer protein
LIFITTHLANVAQDINLIRVTFSTVANYSWLWYKVGKGQTLTQIVEPKQVVFYADENGNEPFGTWLNKLRDKQGRRRILNRLLRVQQGNYGDVEPIGEGLSELRLFFGSGYRVYFGEEEGNIVVILCGGDKDSQSRDIENAKAYWKECKRRASI